VVGVQVVETVVVVIVVAAVVVACHCPSLHRRFKRL
jgi:hypothetical protein